MATVVGIQLNNSTITAGQVVSGLVSVNNTGANPIVVTAISIGVTNPGATNASGAMSGVIPVSILSAGGGAGLPSFFNSSHAFMPTQPNVVNASATQYFPFAYTFHGPQVPGSSNVGVLLNPVVTDATNGNTAAYTANPAVTLGTITPSGTGGSLANGTFAVGVSAVGPFGETKMAESTGQATGGASGSIVVNWTAFPGATSYKVWITAAGGAAGSETNYFVPTAGAVTYTLTTATGTSGTPIATTGTGNFANLAVRPPSIVAQ